MKKFDKKKIFSAFAVLALSAVTACSVFSFSGCTNDGNDDDDTNNNQVAKGNTYYVAPTGGDISVVDGSKDNPFNITSVLGSATFLQPGDTVLVQPGTYKLSSPITMTANGAYNKMITVKNASTTGEKAVLDFSDMGFLGTNRGIQLYSDFVYWYGIDICGAGDNGMYVGGSYNTVEYCEFYNNRDTGLQIGRKQAADTTIDLWPSFNLIKNCTSHNNYDNETYGENADGFAAKLTIGYGNVFDGCIAYRNSDDGWDLYAKSDSGNIGQVIIYNCVAFENGYLEYTQEEYNSLFRYFNSGLAESNTNSYKTRDGDGNGFKLGGSVMDGDVVMYNCLSFNNRMHGVTDNSNPGYLKVEGVTSYNNSAAIDNNPESANFGHITDATNDDTHNNIDVSRQTYSYNTVRNSLSVSDAYVKSLGADAYRGSITDSMLLASGGTNKIVGSIDGDTKNEGGIVNTEKVDAIVSADVFKKLPFTKSGTDYTYNVDVLEDLDKGENRVHKLYRNADGSVNMGEILAVKDYSKLLGENNKIGSQLDKSAWGDYTHFTDDNLYDNAKSKIATVLAKAKETLTVSCDQSACYQNFYVLTKMVDSNISWKSSNENILKVGQKYDVSLSASERVTVDVTRPATDTEVTLTATISYLNRTVEKEFKINVKADTPSLGAMSAVIPSTGEEVPDGGRLIVDMFHQYSEPAIRVENGTYEAGSGKLLRDDQYTLETTYEYAEKDSNNDYDFVTVSEFNPNTAGVYKIICTAKLGNATKSMSYKIFVASTTANVDFKTVTVTENEVEVTKPAVSIAVNRYGYTVTGEPNNVTGTLYAVSSKTALTLSGNDIKEAAGVEAKPFRNDSISFQFANANSEAYYIYYALANAKGEITSQIYETKINVVEIDTNEKFVRLTKGEAIGEENPSETIYMLSRCLDFSEAGNWTSGEKAFTGLLNGNGHTVSGISCVGEDTANQKTSVFYAVNGGTIMNIKFDNITLKSTGDKNGQKVGIVGTCYGGYFYNIQITNIDAYGTQRVAALIGQLNEGTATNIERVSVSNAEGSEKQLYASGGSVGALVGLIQLSSGTSTNRVIEVNISDCYSNLVIGPYRYSGGFVGRYDSQQGNTSYTLNITSCLSASDVYASYNSAGGVIGAQQGSGTMNISKCIFIGKLYHAYGANEPEVLATSQKNASGMVGAFVAAADVHITRCVSLLEEYNSDYQEGVTAYERVTDLCYKFILSARLDETLWDYVYKDGADPEDALAELQLPLATLKFSACDFAAE